MSPVIGQEISFPPYETVYGAFFMFPDFRVILRMFALSTLRFAPVESVTLSIDLSTSFILLVEIAISFSDKRLAPIMPDEFS